MQSRRQVAFEKKIKEISENDKKVRILGIILSSTSDYAILDDGTGSIHVKTDQKLKEKGKYRILGQVYKIEENEFEVVAEIIQDMDKLDLKLYQKVNEIKKEFNLANQELKKND